MTIRRQPEDFIVEELLSERTRAAIAPSPDAGRRFAIFELRKTGLSTPNAVEGLARALGVRAQQTSYAGLKDRHAKTVQHVSVEASEQAIAAIGEKGLSRGDGAGASWHARPIGWMSEPLVAEHIDGNRFTIVVRDLARNTTHEMDRRAHVLRDDDGLLVVNYFGDQRFGSARHGEGFAARHLLRGDFEGALKLLVATPARKDQGATRTLTRAAATHWGDWKAILAAIPRMPERTPFELLAKGQGFREAFASLPSFTQIMCVEAFQSHLWNAVARRMMAGLGDAKTRLEREDPFGLMLFPFARMVPAEWREVSLPLVAPDTQFEPPWADDAAAVLEEEELTMEGLVIPGLRKPYFGEAPRRLLVRAESFTQEKPVPDSFDRTGKRFARTLRFNLPRGSYATVVLRTHGHDSRWPTP
jgi:tRNA pseudouridine13 synthase